MREAVRGWIAQARRIAVLAGAGVSAESGAVLRGTSVRLLPLLL